MKVREIKNRKVFMDIAVVSLIVSSVIGIAGIGAGFWLKKREEKHNKKLEEFKNDLLKEHRIFEDKYATIKQINLEIRQFISIASNLLNAISLITKGVRNYSKEELIKEVHKLLEYIEVYEATIPASRIFLGNDIYKKAMDILMFLKAMEYSIFEIIEDDFNLIETVIDDNNKTLGEYDRLINLTKLRRYAQIHLDKLEELFLNELEKK